MREKNSSSFGTVLHIVRHLVQLLPLNGSRSHVLSNTPLGTVPPPRKNSHHKWNIEPMCSHHTVNLKGTSEQTHYLVPEAILCRKSKMWMTDSSLGPLWAIWVRASWPRSLPAVDFVFFAVLALWLIPHFFWSSSHTLKISPRVCCHILPFEKGKKKCDHAWWVCSPARW
jgi:hypothetical protein